MKVDLFDFDLPNDLIANNPLKNRDDSKMLHISNNITDRKVKDLTDLLSEDDLIIFNNTKVIPARLYGKRKDASIEIMLHNRINGDTWEAFAKPAKKLKINDIFSVADDFYAEILEKKDNGGVILKFNVTDSEFDKALLKYGTIPLPPYIKRKADESDSDNYQTIYAKESGAVAAPTAGLHFTEELFKELEKKKIDKCFLTLHVGAGTFLPVKTDDTTSHQMHSEFCYIDKDTIEKINSAKKNNKRIIAIGTTTVRTLEDRPYWFPNRAEYRAMAKGLYTLNLVPSRTSLKVSISSQE